MFVSMWKYKEEVRKRLLVELQYDRLIDRWNHLVARINHLGGMDFLREAELRRFRKNQPSPLSRDEVNKLIRLCHPDRHNGSETANEMTTKLLSLRKQLR